MKSLADKVLDTHLKKTSHKTPRSTTPKTTPAPDPTPLPIPQAPQLLPPGTTPATAAIEAEKMALGLKKIRSRSLQRTTASESSSGTSRELDQSTTN